MATGSGTGTPASAADSITLASLRARVMQQVTNASSGIDHTPVTASTLTLTTFRTRVETVLKNTGASFALERDALTASALTLANLRDRVEIALQDTGNATWAETDIDEALDQALEQYSRHQPARTIDTVTLGSNGREVDISSLTTPLQIEKVWWPYDSTDPAYPPNWVEFHVWPGDILHLDTPSEPATSDVVRIWHTTAHTLNGLGGASATTFPIDDEAFIVAGAAAFAARFRAIEQAEQANVDDKVFTRLQSWANKMMSEFNEGLRMRQHATRSTYGQDDLDEAIRQALEQYSRRKPAHAIADLTLSATGREVDISSITGLIRVERVWWDYDSSTPGHPPTWRHFVTWPGSIIYVDDANEPQSGDHVRVWYTKEQTLDGLDSASATTIPTDDEAYIVAGAAAFAARFRAGEKGGGSIRLMEWTNKMMAEFNEGLRIRDWRRYTFSYDQNDVDEAIRWALHRHSEIQPDRTITTLALTADGREVDISSITDYLHIERVWWDYDSADPVYPPNWRDFETWPGDVLFIEDGEEPQTSDVVRLWYTRLHTLNGLDSATATSLPADHQTLIVIGASGFVAQERVQDEERRYVPRKLREWADARLREFERGLKALARRQAARHSGLAPGPTLDRWEDGEGWS